MRQIIAEVKAENDLLTKILVKALRKDSDAILHAIQEAGNRAANATKHHLEVEDDGTPVVT